MARSLISKSAFFFAAALICALCLRTESVVFATPLSDVGELGSLQPRFAQVHGRAEAENPKYTVEFSNHPCPMLPSCETYEFQPVASESAAGQKKASAKPGGSKTETVTAGFARPPPGKGASDSKYGEFKNVKVVWKGADANAPLGPTKFNGQVTYFGQDPKANHQPSVLCCRPHLPQPTSSISQKSSRYSSRMGTDAWVVVGETDIANQKIVCSVPNPSNADLDELAKKNPETPVDLTLELGPFLLTATKTWGTYWQTPKTPNSLYLQMIGRDKPIDPNAEKVKFQKLSEQYAMFCNPNVEHDPRQKYVELYLKSVDTNGKKYEVESLEVDKVPNANEWSTDTALRKKFNAPTLSDPHQLDLRENWYFPFKTFFQVVEPYANTILSAKQMTADTIPGLTDKKLTVVHTMCCTGIVNVPKKKIRCTNILRGNSDEDPFFAYTVPAIEKMKPVPLYIYEETYHGSPTDEWKDMKALAKEQLKRCPRTGLTDLAIIQYD